MGLFSFIKNAGSAMFGSKEEEARIEAEVQAKADAQVENLKRLKAARALELRLAALGLGAEGVTIDVNEGVVTLKGKVKDQATAEKIVLAVGNTNGVESVDNDLEVENKVPPATFHTVVSGDTLSKIAKQYLGSANKYPAIFEANKPMLTDPDKIYPGQVLRIPLPAEKA
jgi:nucleoid-associated protein YgaU